MAQAISVPLGPQNYYYYLQIIIIIIYLLPSCTCKIAVAHRFLIDVDCSLSWLKSAKLKAKKYTINAPSFYTEKKDKNGCTKFLTFVGRWSAVDLCCWCC